jgi:hypothetical protein
MLLLELYNTRYEQSLQSGAVDSADQLNEYIPRRKDANYAEFAPGTQVTHSLLGPRVGTVVDVLAIPREDRRESGIPVQVGDRIYWMAPQGLTPIKGIAEGTKLVTDGSIINVYYNGTHIGNIFTSTTKDTPYKAYSKHWDMSRLFKSKKAATDWLAQTHQTAIKEEAQEQGMAEGSEELVGFHLDTELAYQAVMRKFSNVVSQDPESGTMYVPASVWTQVEQVAFDADGRGAEREEGVMEAAKKGLYYYVNRRKAAGTSRDKNDPRAPSAQDWQNAAKTAKKENVELDEKWSQKYKSSIDCSHPKGFSQRAHCAGKNEDQDMVEGETKYDAAWDEKVQRLGQMAKQGERKTVWDPVRRVYTTRPVNAAKTAKPTQENIFSLTEKNSITQTAQSVNEDSNTSSAAAEQAILNRIMTAHIDLLRQFGPEKVMQAAEEVAYNVGDLAEIGTSDVSAYVRQVRQILGAE